MLVYCPAYLSLPAAAAAGIGDLFLNQTVSDMKHTVEVMISEAEIKARVEELGRQITERYQDSGSEMVLVGLLRGSFMFMADLCRQVHVAHEVDFMTASSYGSGMSSTRDVKILKDLDEDIRGKDVLIVEDIIDSGNTLSKVREILSLREPKSLAICTLLDKPSRREVDVAVEYVGFSIPDKFVVGYGIDYAQRYRHLPYIGNVVMLEE
ncbi:Hypoxanthine-guanine phosphoribosyltransferase [Cronobacter turicensis 564]|nr:Hypoxanthine-guanine phosphoribosyltransferase [Cronobacter turicensis 564]